MKKLIVFALLAVTSLTATSALADSIQGRLGITGRIGLLVPADNTADATPAYPTNKTDNGTTWGGGLVYGLTDHIAAEIEVSSTKFGSETGNFKIINYSLGGQYRFTLPHRQLIPYIGAGVDILKTDYEANGSASSDVKTAVGGHLTAGVDYFIWKDKLALTAEAKLLKAQKANITDNLTGDNVGKFDPSSVSTTVGLRYFFN